MGTAIFSQIMEISERDQTILDRRIAGDNLADIARDLGISRQRAKQVFDRVSSPSQKKKALKNAEDRKPIPPPKPAMGVRMMAPRSEPRVRLNIPFARNSDVSQKEIRSCLAEWIDGKFKLDLTARGEKRFSPVIPASMNDKLLEKCQTNGISVATAIRGIIAHLEKELHV